MGCRNINFFSAFVKQSFSCIVYCAACINNVIDNDESTIKKGGVIVNKTKKSMKELIKKRAIGVAEYYANVACPLLTYQPKENKAVKALRKF